MNIHKIVLVVLMTTFALATNSVSLHADSYNYNDWSVPVPAKNGYKVKENGIISGTDIDISLPDDLTPVTITNIQDLFVTDDYYYIVDSDQARLVVLDKQLNTVQVIHTFLETKNSEVITHTFSSPRGVYVTNDGEIYVTDFENQAIYVFDSTYQLIKIITQPENPTYGNREFKVSKIVLDRTKRIYVTVGNVYDGIVEMTNDGVFSRFYGVQQVQTTPIDLIWRRFMTQEQLDKTVLFLPVEYTSMAIDNEGFIYATATSDSQTPIQRLNPKGTDVLRKNGYVKPIGDIVSNPDQDKSNFVGIDVNDYGMYSVLDRANNKIFTYNDEGYLIFVTGRDGEFEGMFKYPTAIAYDQAELIITDSELNTITFLTPTEFGEKVNHVIEMSYNGEYLNVTNLWEDIIAEDANFSYAYVGIGNALFRDKDYKAAMEAFQLGSDKEGYGKAYKQYRKELLRDNFPIIGVTATGIIIVTILRPIINDIRKKGE